jgi:hypothetical protein
MFEYSVSKFFNFIQKDTLLDWLELFGKSAGFHKKKCKVQEMLFSSGIEMEKNVVEEIKKSRNITDLTHLKFQNFTHQNKTIELMKKKTEIIYQGFLCGGEEYNNKRPYGMPDLIIRKDIFHQMTNNKFNMEENDDMDEDYVIVDVKRSLKLNKNHTVSKSTSNYAWMEFQLCAYEEFLSSVLKRGNNDVFVCSMNKNNELDFGRVPFVKPAIQEIINYWEQLKKEGNKWVPYPKPTCKYMYPNMKNIYDNEWRHIKEDIAKKIGELTLLPYISVAIREQLWNQNIFSIHDEGVEDELEKIPRVPKFVVNIVMANKQEGSEINADKIKEDLMQIIDNRKLLFVDLETSKNNKVFLSCVYNFENKEYRHFWCGKDDIINNESRVINETKEYIKTLQKEKVEDDEEKVDNKDDTKDKKENYCVVYYGGQEAKLLEIKNGLDLYEVIKQNHYAKHGLMSYGLKDIYNESFRRKIETKITNGYDAMCLYDSSDDEDVRKDLYEYVQKDVDILALLVNRFLNW